MSKNIRTTVALSEELLAAVDRAVREGKARSRNEFLNMALRRELAALERARIDEAFGFMVRDPLYQDEAERLADEFDGAWRFRSRSGSRCGPCRRLGSGVGGERFPPKPSPS